MISLFQPTGRPITHTTAGRVALSVGPRLDIPNLRAAVQHYFEQGLAPSTKKSYLAGQKRYFSFCNSINALPIPTTEDILLTFVSYLAQDGISHATIKVYLSAIRSLHISKGLHEVYSAQLTPRVEQVLKGIKKEDALKHSKQARLPVTLDILTRLKPIMLHYPGGHDGILLWAACCLAFFGFLRCGEFTVPSQSEFDPSTHLSLADIAVDCREAPTVIQVHIKQSKTDPFRQGVHLYLGKTGNNICPVEAMLPYLAIRGATPCPVFILKDGSFLTRQKFAALVATCLGKANISDKGYSTHSFRIGAATTAKEAGISDLHIKMLGRWKSEAYQLYIRTPRTQLAKLSKLISQPKPT